MYVLMKDKYQNNLNTHNGNSPTGVDPMGLDFKNDFLKIITLIVAVVVAALLIWMALAYNNMVALEMDIDAQWSEIYNQEDRKMDLIPELVAQSSQYQEFEASTLTRITELRANWDNATTDQERADISDESQSLIGEIRVTFEAYPDLKSNTILLGLMDEMAGTENRIAYARTLYIDGIRGYNTGIKTFPNVMVAGAFGFQARDNLYGSAPAP